jgi:hypothetical protein
MIHKSNSADKPRSLPASGNPEEGKTPIILSEKMAYIIMTELWDWCAENPAERKWDWPGWEKYGRMHSWCPACEFENQQREEHSRCLILCLMKQLWPKGCMHGESAYQKYISSKTEEERSLYAKEIADFARKKLEELK